jgi:hypothetical protein
MNEKKKVHSTFTAGCFQRTKRKKMPRNTSENNNRDTTYTNIFIYLFKIKMSELFMAQLGIPMEDIQILRARHLKTRVRCTHKKEKKVLDKSPFDGNSGKVNIRSVCSVHITI